MTKTRTSTTTTIDSANTNERRNEALAWASRQLRFEHLMTSLERGRAD